jgi:hypothetical protein
MPVPSRRPPPIWSGWNRFTPGCWPRRRSSFAAFREQVEELKTANRLLLEVYQGRLLPALVENNRLTALYIEYLQERRS